MTTINPHINFNGNCQEAFDFYRSVFGSEFSKVIHLKDLASPEFPVDPADENKLLRIALSIGNNFLIGNDVPSFLGKVSEQENRSKILVNADSKEEADKLFQGLSFGGQVEMPLSESPWGGYFAMFRDKYGVEWEIEYSSK